MKVKRIGEKIQAIIDPGECLRLGAENSTDPENKKYVTISDAIRGGVFRLLHAHALDKLDGMTIGWGAVDFVDGNYVVTYGPLKSSPHTMEVPGAKNG